EAIELQMFRPLVEQPGAVGLRRNDGAQALAVEGGERRVVDYHGEMEHSAQRLGAGGDLREQARNILRRAGIRANDAHLRASSAQALHEGFRLGSGRAAAAAQDEMFRARFYQPLRQHLAEAAKGAGDEITTV